MKEALGGVARSVVWASQMHLKVLDGFQVRAHKWITRPVPSRVCRRWLLILDSHITLMCLFFFFSLSKAVKIFFKGERIKKQTTQPTNRKSMVITRREGEWGKAVENIVGTNVLRWRTQNTIYK